jgi:hypothetical protein
MKDQTSIIITAVVIAYAAVRIYQKYFRKDNKQSVKGDSSNKGTGFPPSHGSDDYEPYSKK